MKKKNEKMKKKNEKMKKKKQIDFFLFIIILSNLNNIVII